MTMVAQDNAAYVLTCTAPTLLADLAPAVSNSGEVDAAARWVIQFVVDWLRSKEQSDAPLAALDFVIWDIEQLEAIWAGFRLVAGEVEGGREALPKIAEFMVRRLPTVWDRKSPIGIAPPVTNAVAMADRIDTLVTLWAAGEAPTGSRDPYALRRAGLDIWRRICGPTVADFTCGEAQG